MTSLPPTIESILRTPEFSMGVDDAVVARLANEPSFRTDLLAEATKVLDEYSYRPSVNVAGFPLQATGTLHPMSPYICPSPGCRRRKLRAFAQVAALYSDTTVLTDTFSQRLLSKAQSNGPWEDSDVDMLIADVVTILELQPLIRAGALQFSSPVHRLCPVHDKPTWELVSRIGERALDELLLDSMNIEIHDNGFLVRSHVFGDGSSGLEVSQDEIQALKALKSDEDRRKLVASKFRKELLEIVVNRTQYAMIDCRCAAESGATVAATSPIDILTSRSVFEPAPDGALEMDVARVACVNLPWIPHLTISELVELRERAARALPNFRFEIARQMQSGTSAEVREIAKSLQGEVAGLDGELRAAMAKRTGGAGPAAILGGLGMILCGIATANPLLAAGGAPLVGGGCSIWSTDKTAVSEIELARSKPAYVLLTARELLESRH